MVRLSRQRGLDFNDVNILPDHTPEGCKVTTVSIDTMLGNLHLNIPLLSAAMGSVTGYDMALALGKEGGLGVLPVRMELADKLEAIASIKSHGVNFVERPVHAYDSDSLDKVIRLVEQHGHSKIPIVDQNNKFMGMFDMDRYMETSQAKHSSRVSDYMIGYDDVLRVDNPDITTTEAKALLDKKGLNYLVVMDEQKHLAKLFFRRDAEPIPVAAAISSHDGWKDSAIALLRAGADMIVVDSSDSDNDYVKRLIKAYKKLPEAKERGTPLCIGNVVTYKSAISLMRWGADIVKIGMATGSICTTRKVKGVGRPILTALLAADKARADYFKTSGRYVPIIADGGVDDTAALNIALTISDAVMRGGYFNSFFEAAGEKCDESKKILNDPVAYEDKIRWVVTYGEGSDYARNLVRYGHDQFKTFCAEGEYGHVEYRGRLKPGVNQDMKVLRAAMVNVGAMNLIQYREKAELEEMSEAAKRKTANTHNMVVQK